MSTNNEMQLKVLAIDDEVSMLNLLQSILEEEYQVITCDNAEDGVTAIHHKKPDIIIMDINLGKAHGVETVKLIKNDPDNKDIPIILISGLSTTEDRIAGYEAGASDFISKPFSKDELLYKVRLNVEFYTKIREKNRMIDETRDMAFTAMSQSGEIGQILHFMRDSFECSTYDSLGSRILEYMENEQLYSAILIKSQPEIYFTHESEIARVDKEILDRLNKLERIIDFGKRTLYNFENISLLVKNMPLEDPNRYGRIKDNVCLVLEAADARVIALNNEVKIQLHYEALSEIVNSSKFTLKDIEMSFQKNARLNTEIMHRLKEKVEQSFLRLGLSEEQELEIADIIDDAEKESNALYDEGLNIEDRINDLAEEFASITGKSK